MVAWRNPEMGRFSVEIELANNDDLARARAGDIPTDQVRRAHVRGMVDSGAAKLVLPESIVQQLGLRLAGKADVRYADGHVAERDMAQGVELTYAGRIGVFSAVVEPKRDSALIGAIVMEDLDLIVDFTKQRLEPRDPGKIISEIE